MKPEQVAAQEAGERLDKWMVKRFPEHSRSAIQKSIIAGQVHVNGKTVAVHTFLKEGDMVEYEIAPVSKQTTQVEPNSTVDFSVVEETPEYVVINKPAGVVMYQSSNHTEPDTLANGLLARYPEVKGVGDDPFRPGIVHRLDQHVSGLLVVARTPESYKNLHDQFEKRDVVKEYIAVVHGTVTQPSGKIDFPIARSVTEPTKMAARPHSAAGQHAGRYAEREALTEYTVDKQFQQYAVLRVRIHTGRTHQIRVHLNAIGHPIVGDEIYKPKSLKTSLHPGRVMLHAAQLSFADVSGIQHTYTTPLPPEMEELINGFV